ncbi:DUF393 domain-containing protein [Flavobacterium sp. NST-5]|uniref:DUF393 domain-containing protein n=1 Tax=Flavobacterium ichthyis TaxID=2698827 RepID=A0ABW9ZA85_9FLAO|nr:DUF393 domain-containing protein [Flavobacterium ichthyis]
MKGVSLYIVYDNWCSNCTNFVKLVKRLDWFGLISPVPLRNLEVRSLPSGLDQQKAQLSMASFNRKWHYGFETLFSVSKRLPLLWAFLPCVYLIKICGAGSYIYNTISIRRKINCTDACGLNQ